MTKRTQEGIETKGTGIFEVLVQCSSFRRSDSLRLWCGFQFKVYDLKRRA